MRATQISFAIAAAGLAAALGATGCNAVFGINKDPSLGTPDQMIDGNTTPIDGAVSDVAIDMNPGACGGATCAFGCDTGTNTCRAAKLWLYLSTGAYVGNGFGGADQPPDVRATADATCFATVTASFPDRACTKDRTHAVVTVSGADSIQTMSAVYNIPLTVTVNSVQSAVDIHRADDDVLVADDWNALTATAKTRAPAASAATAATDAAGVVWTGFGPGGASNCTGWTSNASGVSGVAGHTTMSDSAVLWLGSGSVACNLLQRLLCVCWSGGQ